jgi:hypothetical protein
MSLGCATDSLNVEKSLGASYDVRPTRAVGECLVNQQDANSLAAISLTTGRCTDSLAVIFAFRDAE